MEKEDISKLLKEMAEILELEGENPFKVKAYYDASRIVLGIENLKREIEEDKLKERKGIGQSLSNFIKVIYEKGTHPVLEEFKKKYPPTFLELLKIKNLGPKKIAILNKELNITSIQDLKYAIYENRLLNLPGFGEKTQEKIKESLKFYESQRGKFLLSEAIELERKILKEFPFLFPVGVLRRRMPIIDSFEFLLKDLSLKNFAEKFIKVPLSFFEDYLTFNFLNLNIRVYEGGKNFYFKFFEKTGSEEHIKKLEEFGKIPREVNSEEEIYFNLGLEFIPPEMREGKGEIALAKDKLISKVLSFEDIKGSLHNHTEESDGASSIEDYLKVCKNLNYNFIGIADHSKSAKYAGGLLEEELLNQREKIKILNEKSEVYIFHGVESDIHPDGNLDYDEEILKKLDYVVVSVHSHFNLNKDKQTERILKAISNPYSKILGHPEGRLLLGRKGYEVDMEKLIEGVSKEKKIIELNSNPLRLDLDWQYLDKAQKMGILISINPDAHYREDLKDIFYGVLMARKGLLFKENCINTWELEKLKEEFKSNE